MQGLCAGSNTQAQGHPPKCPAYRPTTRTGVQEATGLQPVQALYQVSRFQAYHTYRHKRIYLSLKIFILRKKTLFLFLGPFFILGRVQKHDLRGSQPRETGSFWTLFGPI